MSKKHEAFATHVGCMDGRVQEPTLKFAKNRFGVKFVDTITEAGMVGLLVHNPTPKFLERLRIKINISVDKHGSKAIIVEGHEECAGNPVGEEIHKSHIRKSIEVLKSLVDTSTPIIGVYVKQQDGDWVVEEVPETEIA